MPWQDNSGDKGGPTRGPWGQNPKGDGGRGNGGWGNGGDNGGQNGGKGEPPDLEELLQASRQRLRKAFPRGAGGGGRGGRGGRDIDPRVLGLGAVAIGALWLASGFYSINAGELGVVTTFGKYDTVTLPGLRWRVPSPIQNVDIVDVETINTIHIPATQRTSNGAGLMLTGDKNIVDVALNVQYQINPDLTEEDGKLPEVAKYLYNIDEATNLVRTVAEASIREVVGRNTLDFVQTQGRTQVQQETEALIQSALDQYDAGILITAISLQKTDPPTSEVNQAFLDVEAADQDRQRSIDAARAYANRILPEARGEAQRILEDARGYSARVTAESRGQANRFDAILAEYKKAPEVTRQRMYLETVETVLGDMNKIIVEDNAGSGVVPYLPLNELSRRQGE